MEGIENKHSSFFFNREVPCWYTLSHSEKEENMKGKRKGGWRERIMAGFPWCSEWEMTVISSVSEKLPKKRGKYICLSFFFFYNTLFFSPHLYNSTKSVKEIKFHFLEAFPNYSSPRSSFFNSSIVIVLWLKYHFTLFIGLTCVCFLFLNHVFITTT